MAENTISEEIADLEAKILVLDDHIKENQQLSEVEEGGSNANFSTKFSDIKKLYDRRDILSLRLNTLYRYQR